MRGKNQGLPPKRGQVPGEPERALDAGARGEGWKMIRHHKQAFHALTNARSLLHIAAPTGVSRRRFCEESGCCWKK
jgi:hypothetical protein